MVSAATSEARSEELRARGRGFSFGFLSSQPIGALTDVLLLLAAGWLAQAVYVVPKPSTEEMFGAVVIAATIFVALAYLTGSYQPGVHKTRSRAIGSALRLWAITICFLALAGFLLKAGDQFSRISVTIFVLTAAAFIAVHRAVWPSIVRNAVDRGLIFVTRVLVLRVQRQRAVEARGDAADIVELRQSGLQPVAIRTVSLDDGPDQWTTALDFVGEQIRLGRIEEIVILADFDTLAAVEQIVERLRVFPLPVRFVLDPSMRRLLDRNLSRAGACVLAEYQRAPLSSAERMMKRALDITVALCGLLILSPLLVIVALAIKLDSPGPVLFRQYRRGFGGRPFSILKFRSMTVADNGAVVVQAQRNDARVTRVGRWIRRTSLDELPQLFNVLGGEMSIVGPRPHAVAHDDYYSRFIEEYAFRHHAKPGLTGWAQVKGLRGETPQIENMKARIEKDIWYIDNWSIALDVAIIMRTAFSLVRHRTAY